MSLRGRRVLDRLQRFMGKRYKLPAPPYGQPAYWESCYKALSPHDTMEWGNLSYQDLKHFEYHVLDYDAPSGTSTMHPQELQTTLLDTLRLRQNAGDETKDMAVAKPLLMIGCGNSTMAEDIVTDNDSRLLGRVIQIDVTQSALNAARARIAQASPVWVLDAMKFVHDDATELAKFENASMLAVLDKGLLDALYLAGEYEQCQRMLRAIQRVLVPGGIFVTFSFSRPEFLLPLVTENFQTKRHDVNAGLWHSLHIKQLDHILLYRFENARDEEFRVRRRGGRRR